MTESQKPDSLTVEMVTEAMNAIENATYEPEPYFVHSCEYAWIKEPVGPAPTRNAIQVALAVDSVTIEHPEARRLTDLVRPAASGELVNIGKLPGCFFCPRCDRNRWFREHSVCAACGGREREIAAPGGLNPSREQLSAMRRREHLDPREALVVKMHRLGLILAGDSGEDQ